MAEAQFTHQRLLDLVRFMRIELHEQDLITDEEYAALVADSEKGQRVARLEGYDAMRNALTRAEQEIARLKGLGTREEGLQEALTVVRRFDYFERQMHMTEDAILALLPKAVPDGQ